MLRHYSFLTSRSSEQKAFLEHYVTDIEGL